MKTFRSLFSLLLLSSLGALPVAASAPPAPRPNILYILLDDAGYGDFGCYGQKKLRTPNIDRLASEGLKFTRHYAGSTVCAPSRCVLMTGLHTGHSRIRANGPSHLPDTDLNVARILKDAGYLTACIGKYGLGMPLPPDDPQRKGFDYSFGYVDTAHAHNGYPTYLFRNGAKVPFDNQIIPGSENKPGTGVAPIDGRKHWAPQLLADDVQRFLEERAQDRSKPLFLYYTPILPHANIDRPDPVVSARGSRLVRSALTSIASTAASGLPLAKQSTTNKQRHGVRTIAGHMSRSGANSTP